MKVKPWPPKCCFCGKFIKLEDFANLSAQLTFQWGVHGEENTKYFHIICKENYENGNEQN